MMGRWLHSQPLAATLGQGLLFTMLLALGLVAWPGYLDLASAALVLCALVFTLLPGTFLRLALVGRLWSRIPSDRRPSVGALWALGEMALAGLALATYAWAMLAPGWGTVALVVHVLVCLVADAVLLVALLGWEAGRRWRGMVGRGPVPPEELPRDLPGEDRS